MLIRYPLNPAFMSLNLAQAVMVMAYEWWMAAEESLPRMLMTNETRIATKGELENFLGHLVRELDDCGFLQHPPPVPARRGDGAGTAYPSRRHHRTGARPPRAQLSDGGAASSVRGRYPIG
jgi:hypothetical protein